MHSKIKLTVSHIQTIYIIISFFIFLFVNVSESVGIEILVPHFESLAIYWHISLLTIIFLMILIVKKGYIYIDLVGKLLLLKCGTDLISYLINIDTISDGYFGYYACSVTAFFSYVIMTQTPCYVKKYYKYFLGFGVLLAIQTMHTCYLMGIAYSDVWYKTYMNIPYGATNIIASGIVPLIVLPFFMNIKKGLKVVLVVVLVSGVVLTKSRGGMLLTLCAIAYAALFTDLFRKNRRIKKLLFIAIVVIVLMLILFNNSFEMFFIGYFDSGFDLNSLSSGRVNIFINDLIQFTKQPIFGHGLGYGGTNISGSHNLLIDLLYKCGIVGFVLYCSALIYIQKRKNTSFFSYFIFIMFLNSLFEVCYFSYKCDTIFWCAAGLAMSQSSIVGEDIERRINN